MNILEKVLNKIKLNKATKKFLLILIEGMIGITGKRTFRNLARYMGKDEHTFARQMEKDINFAELNTEMIKETKGKDEVMIGAQDASFASKSGNLTYGLGPFWNGCEGRVEKGLEIDLIAVVKIGEKKEAYALSAEQTKPDASSSDKAADTPKKNKKKAKNDDPTRIDFYLDHVIKVFPRLVELLIKYMVVDAFFAKIKYVQGVCNLGLNVVSKLRIDAQLRRFYIGPQKPSGRKRKFDENKITLDDFNDCPIIRVEEENIELTSLIVYSVSLKREIKVVRMRQLLNNNKYRDVLLFSTNLEQNTLEIYQFYTARFHIEFIFRDAKQFTGLTDCQSRDARRLHYHFNASLLSLNVAKIQDAEFQKINQINIPFSMANWSRKYFVQILLKHIFSTLGLDPTLIKCHPQYEDLINFGKINH